MSNRTLAGALGVLFVASFALAGEERHGAMAHTLVVDNDGAATASDCDAATATPYLTIQAAIDAAAPGDTVVVCPGTGPYNEQPVIGKALILRGRADATVKPSPMAANSTNLVNGNPIAAGILVSDTTGVSIRSLTVDGIDNASGPGCSLTNVVGIFFRNASGAVQNAAVQNMKLAPGLEGCQSGQGIFVQSGLGLKSNVLVEGTSVHDYQKNGIVGNEVGTTLTARQNRVTGWGPTPFIAQNGIQVAFGAAGNVEENVVANHVWTPCFGPGPGECDFISTDVLVLQADAARVTVKNNVLVNSQIGLYYNASGGTVGGNDISQTKVWDGIYVQGDNNLIQSNNVSSSDESGIFLAGDTNRVRSNRINQTPVGIWSYLGANVIPMTGARQNSFFNVGTNVNVGIVVPRAAARASLGGSRPDAPAASPMR